MSRLAGLGRHIAELQNRKLGEIQRHSTATPEAIGEQLLRKSRLRRRRRRMVVGAGLAMVLAAGSLTVANRVMAPERAALAMVHAEAGQRVTASLLDVAVGFEDGSNAVISAGSVLRTEMVGPATASLRLERGHVRVRVIHAPATHYTVHAGPYTVAVTGTRFRVQWGPDKGAFAVSVDEGSVRVSGGLLAEPLDIFPGQSIPLEQGREIAGRTTEPGTHVPEPAAALPLPAPEAVAPPPGESPPAAAEPATTGHRPTARHLTTPTWRQQADAGHYREAMEEAERRGFEGICHDASGPELLTLAEAARYTGQTSRAEQALKTVRARFGRSEEAAMSAYLLGRIAAEVRHDYSGAATWFRSYLVERPGGRLNREAEGRLLESLAFMDCDTAREAARKYLEHYPSGPHAAFARNLLGP